MVTPRKKKTTGKKAVSKRGSSKGATPRKSSKDKQKLNQQRLAEDIAYYNNVAPGKIRRAPVYVPMHKNGKVVAYRNGINGDIVTPHYRRKYFAKYFNPNPPVNESLTDEEYARVESYGQNLVNQRRLRTARSKDIVGSYQIRHPDMSRKEIRSSPEFQRLVMQLESYSARAYGITPENIEILDEIYGPADYGTYLKGELGKNPQYQEVLVELGRRAPGEDFPVGESGKNHIELVVKPYYQNPMHLPNHASIIKDFEE